MWHFNNKNLENSHCLPEQVEGYLAGTCSDGNASALLKLLPIAGSDFCNGNGKDICRRSPSGMTLRRSTGGRGMESLTWYRGDSLVRTYLPPAKAPGSAGAEADCGPSLPGSLAKFNPDSYGWKTRQCLLFGGLISFAGTWPRWGMMQNGELFPLPTPSGLSLLRLVISRHSTTFGNESGFVQRAPTAKASPSGPDFARTNRPGSGGDDLATAVARVPTPRCEDSQCAGGHRGMDDTLYGMICRPKTVRIPTVTKSMMTAQDMEQARFAGNGGKRPEYAKICRMPTPRAAEHCQHNSHDNGMALSAAVRMPTLHGFSKDGKSNGPSGNELGRAVNRMPTCRSQKTTSENPETWQKRKDAGKVSTPPLAMVAGGSLNPDWVEWLHGWPIGWTGSAPLETVRFQQWLNSHGIY